MPAAPGIVLVPAGSFTMGAVSGKFNADETPPHSVYLDNYSIDITEVTTAQFARFVDSSGYQTDAEKAGDSTTWRSLNSPDRQRFPVIFVSWNDAARYCAWAGKRLPTEAYQRVARHHMLDVRPFNEVAAVEKSGGRFLVRTARGSLYEARTVVVATGYFDNPNRLGVPGEDIPSVSHYYDEPYRWFDRDVTVVGGRNSAVEAALDLYRNGARVTLLHRGPTLSEGVKYWILPDMENRIRAGNIKAIFNASCEQFREGNVLVRTPGGVCEVQSDFTYVLIGFHPDVAMLRRFGIEVEEETLAPRVDPDTLETSVAGLFAAGSVVAGRFTNRIFVENGRLHGSNIIPAALKYVRNP